MVERQGRRPSFSKEQKTRQALYLFAKHARRNYFADELRNEKKNSDLFDVYERVPESALEAVENSANRTLEDGGGVAIIDLTQKGKILAHTLSPGRYARFYFGFRDIREVEQKGDFAVLLSGSKIPGGPSLFLDMVSEKSAFNVSWQESEDPNARFAVMTYRKGVWELLLDFRINTWEGEPSWKVNAGVHSGMR